MEPPELIARVLSYNIFLRPPGVHEKHSNDYKNERLNLFLEKELHKWDIVAFQELFGTFSHRRHKLVKHAKEWGFLYHAESPMGLKSKHLVDGGLVIVSKYPILESDYHVFKESASSDALAAKGVLYAKIELRSDIVVHHFTTHLQASYASKESEKEKFLKIRESQLRELLEFINWKTYNDVYPILLLGDMNTNMELGEGPPEEYLKMMEILGSRYFCPIDILYHIYGQRPITGFSEDIVKLHTDGSAFEKPQSWRSLDYILFLIRKNFNSITSWQVKDVQHVSQVTKKTEVIEPAKQKYILDTGRKIEMTTVTGAHVEIQGSVEGFQCPTWSEFSQLSDHFEFLPLSQSESQFPIRYLDN